MLEDHPIGQHQRWMQCLGASPERTEGQFGCPYENGHRAWWSTEPPQCILQWCILADDCEQSTRLRTAPALARRVGYCPVLGASFRHHAIIQLASQSSTESVPNQVAHTILEHRRPHSCTSPRSGDLAGFMPQSWPNHTCLCAASDPFGYLHPKPKATNPYSPAAEKRT